MEASDEWRQVRRSDEFRGGPIDNPPARVIVNNDHSIIRRLRMDVLKVYQYALQREFEGKRFFEENAGRLSHSAAVGAFKNLAAEEQKHIDFIQDLIDRIKKGESPNLSMAKEMQNEGFFSQRAISESIDSKTLEAMVPDLPILRMAYLIERDFAEFYEKAAKEAEGEVKEALTMLASWEHGHEELFQQFHDKAFQEYSKMPWGG